MFIQQLFAAPALFIAHVLMVVFSICCHEYAHAWVALKQGDRTAADAGHLTLNPMVQMGPMSLIMLLICGIAWGAVPVRPDRMRHHYSHALVSFAGPAMNLLLAVGFTLGCTVMVARFGQDSVYANYLFRGAVMNIVLALFNLLPVPPLDGWTVLSFFFPRLAQTNSELRNASLFILLIGFMVVSDKVFRAAEMVVGLMVSIPLALFQGLTGG